MNVLVTGGAGFIGSNFIIYMFGKYNDYKIVWMDKLTYAGNINNLIKVYDNPNFIFSKIDITSREEVYACFERGNFDIVVNFAAESHAGRSIEEPDIFINTNVVGVGVLFDA